MPDVFISYSRRDLAAVKPIKGELERLGFSCWMDLEGIESGSRTFSKHIIDAIDASGSMLFFLSGSSQRSEWALKEIDYAAAEGKRVVLVRFNDDPMTKEFRFDFGRADVIDWRAPEQRAKLVGNLRSWKGLPPPAPVAGAAPPRAAGKSLAAQFGSFLLFLAVCFAAGVAIGFVLWLAGRLR